jgi:hypothetical protein
MEKSVAELKKAKERRANAEADSETPLPKVDTVSKRHGLDLLAIEAKDVILLTQPTKDALVCHSIATCLSS